MCCGYENPGRCEGQGPQHILQLRQSEVKGHMTLKGCAESSDGVPPGDAHNSASSFLDRPATQTPVTAPVNERETLLRPQGLGPEATLQAKEELVEEPYLTFFLGRKLLVWPHFFLRQLTARGCRRA